MSNPVVSVIVLTYNQEETLGQTLDSILSQRTDYSFEVVVGEDGSTDQTRAVAQGYVDKYPAVVRLMPAAPNKGLVRNYIDCIKACRGSYIACCAGDDYWCDEQKIERQVAFLQANSDYVLTHAEMIAWDIATGQMHKHPLRSNLPEEGVAEVLCKRDLVIAPTACFRSDFIQHIDFDKWVELGFKMEDLPMWLEASQWGKFHYMPFYAVTYRVFPESASRSTNWKRSLTFMDSAYACRYYYWDKFRPNFPRKELEEEHKKRAIECILGSKQMIPIFKAMFRFGPCSVLRFGVQKMWWKAKK